MFCTECGKEIPDGSAFCTECGAQITGAAPPPAAPPGTALPPVVPGTKPKSKKTMIGIIIGVVSLLVVVAVVLVLVLVVFKGGDTAKAKEYMKKGDKKRQSVAEKATASGNAGDKLFNDLKAGTITTSQDFNNRAETIKADFSDVESGAEEARSDFEKIKDLNDVEDYKKYATLRIESIDALLEALKTEQELMDYTGEFFASIEAGGSTDTSAYEQKAGEYVQRITDLVDKGKSASAKAESLKKDKKL